MSGPVSPKDIASVQSSTIPEFVFEAINELIALKWDGSAAVVPVHEIATRACSKAQIERNAFDPLWVNIGAAYGAAGWSVVYDRPGMYENYSAFFRFTKRD